MQFIERECNEFADSCNASECRKIQQHATTITKLTNLAEISMSRLEACGSLPEGTQDTQSDQVFLSPLPLEHGGAFPS